MKLISLKEYAEQKGISYEAVRQQVARYRDELGDHVVVDGRQMFLDEEAVAFLDERRQKNPVVMIQESKDEAIEALRADREQLLIKVAAQADRISELAEWKADHALAIAAAEHHELQLKAAEDDKAQLKAQLAEEQVAHQRDKEEAAAALQAEQEEKLEALKAKRAAEVEIDKLWEQLAAAEAELEKPWWQRKRRKKK